jgi:hypothetical protein
MNRIRLVGICGVVVATMAVGADAQLLRRVDPNKEADLGNPNITAPTLNLETLPQPGRSLPPSALSGRERALNEVRFHDVTLGEARFHDVPTQRVPTQNFTSRRAAVSEQFRSQRQVSHGAAPIPDRQIRPFMPGGEEELKEQLKIPY